MNKNIIILGGGTSGLLSALMMKQAYANFDIKLIESDRIGIIGVGEGATEHWNILCNFLNIPLNDAITHCGATMKAGIIFKDWGVPDYYHSVSSEYMWKNGESFPIYSKLISENVDPIKLCAIGSKNPDIPLSWVNGCEESECKQFHFNTFKLNDFLHKLCNERNIEIIKDEITDVVIENNIVTKLVGNKEYFADFFIDCSGFARVIIGKLNATWKSYNKHLITNSAIAFPTDDTEEYPKYTTVTAMKYGWMWNTPVQGRWGNGYVFCDKFINFDKAQQEVENLLGKKINIFKKIKFDPGTLDKSWISNCCAIGLSSGFVEPLESSAISQGLLQTWILINLFCGWENSKTSTEDLYNQKVQAISENILDFIAVHFITPREDTEFWKFLKYNREEWVPARLLQNLEKWKDRLPYSFEFDSLWTLFKAENWILTLYGLQLFDTNSIKKQYDLMPGSIKSYVDNYLREEREFVNSREYISHKKGIESFLKNQNKVEYKS